VARLNPIWINVAFALLFPLLAVLVIGSEHAGEVCSRVMGGSDATAKFWYEIPCSPDMRDRSGLNGYGWAYLGLFVVTGMYSGIVFPAVTGLTGVTLERFAPRWTNKVDWAVTVVLALIPPVALFLAFG
jgi:hypothetical protein